MYPRMLGQPMYPGGAPVSPDNCSYEDQTARQLYWLESNDKATKDQIKMLKEYWIYYLKAPIWKLDIKEEEKRLKKPLEKFSVEELWHFSMINGLDPF